MKTNKEIEQAAIDLWLEGKIAIGHFVTSLYDFQLRRGLRKADIYSHEGAERCPRCNLIYPNAVPWGHQCVSSP